MWHDLSQKTSPRGTFIASVSGMWLTISHLSLITSFISFWNSAEFFFFFFNTKSSVSQNNAQGLFIGVWMWEDQFVTFAWDSSSKRTVKLRQFFHYCDFHISSHILHLNVREVLARKATCRFPKPFSVSALSPNFDSSNAAIAIFTSWILFALDLPRHISTQSHISKLHL